ncbi:MAG: VCBS repeat-containing protein [Acidobacteria bacterium]|nr:VCBS repeat-containing protein [Acidobacteriota bacterium]
MGDFDGDRKADIAVFRAAAAGHVLLSRQPLESGRQQSSSSGERPATRQRRKGDFNGNGKADFAVWRAGYGGGSWSDSFAVTTINFGTTGNKLVPGDYDGDGRTDTAVFRPSEVNGMCSAVRRRTAAVPTVGESRLTCRSRPFHGSDSQTDLRDLPR